MDQRVLVVDDDARVRRTFSRNLKLEGYSVLTAADGQEALEAYAQERPDIALVDVRMPHLDGFQVLEAIRTQDAEAEVILVTGHGDMDTAIEALRLGASDFISKPVERRALEAALRRAQKRLRMKKELTAAREALKASEAHYRAITETALVGVSVTAPDETITFTNEAFARMVGYRREELVGMSLRELTTPEEFRRYREETIHRKDGQRDQYETVLLRQDGTNLNVLVSAAPLVNAEGEFQQTLAVITDITEQKQAEETLRRYASEQAALYAVTAAVATSLDPEEILNTVLDTLLPMVGSEAGWVKLPGPTLDDPPQVVAWRGIPAPLLTAESEIPFRLCDGCPSLTASDDLAGRPKLIHQCSKVAPEILAAAGIEQHIGVSLIAGDEVLGILCIAWPSARPYTESEEALLMAISQQVGTGLHNAQLYQSALQVDRLRVINELDQALATTLNPKTIAEIALNHVAEALDAPLAALSLMFMSAQAKPVPTYVRDQGWVDMVKAEAQLDHLQAKLSSTSGESEVISISAQELVELAPAGHKDLGERWGPEGLVVPILGDYEVSAVLALGGRPVSRPFTAEDRALVKAAAGRAGQAIQNARLYQASQDQTARLATLNAITQAAVSSLELNVVLRQVLDLTCQALDSVEGSILMKDPKTGELIFTLTLAEEGLKGQRLAPGQGVAGWVAEHGEAVLVNDVMEDTRWFSGLDDATDFETESLLCAPLMHRERITGVIEIVNRRRGRFTEDDLSLLKSVSSIASVALENARLFTTTRERAEELALLNEIGLSLTSTLDFSKVVHSALSQIRLLLQAEGVSLLQTDPQTGELYFVEALSGRRQLDIPVRLSPGEGIAGWVMLQEEPVLIENVQDDPRFSDRVDRHLEHSTRSLMAIPLLTPERTVGVIEVVSNEKGIYTEDDLRILQSVASVLTVALENARLYEELKELLRERERAQAQLIHSEKMGALGRLAASLAHEINNPLQSVDGCLTLVEEELDEEGRRDKLERYLSIAGDEIQRISAIVRRMRDFYRPAGEGTQETALHDTLDSVLELSRKKLQHSNVTMERRWGQEIPLIQANPDHLKQVFLNLLLNAVDAMPQGGKISIQTTRDQIAPQDGRPPLPAVRLEFRDTGHGIAPEVLPHIFEPFFTTKEHGSGLGLYISYGIIRAHNGIIRAESEPGAGATFTILLPVRQP
jgi:two-component system NtrC family sensor kinase